MAGLDETDMRIFSALYSNASPSVPRHSRHLGVKQSVAYSRISRLQRRGVIEKFTVQINEDLLCLKGRVVAGINVDPKEREYVLSKLEKIEEVRLIREVTGRFDVLVDLRGDSLEDLSKTISGTIGNLNGVIHVEVFTEISRHDTLPKFRIFETSQNHRPASLVLRSNLGSLLVVAESS